MSTQVFEAAALALSQGLAAGLFARLWRRQGLAWAGWVAAWHAACAVVAGVGWPDTVGPALALAPLPLCSLALLALQFARTQELAQQAQASRDQLCRRLEQLSQEGRQREAALERTVSELKGFNLAVSHDLRGPLGGMAHLAQVAQQHALQGEPDQAARLLRVIAEQADGSRRLVDGLLALAQVREMALQVRQVDTQQLVNDVIESIQAVSQRVLPVLMLNRLPVVEADGDLLRQVFVNLIGNAVKFSAGVQQPCVEIGVEPGPIFLVRDNGVGFAAEHADQLFQPFRRLQPQGFDGHGVGLSIVRRIVESHGGRVWAQAAPGAGASFFFRLGRAAPGEEHPPARRAQAPSLP